MFTQGLSWRTPSTPLSEPGGRRADAASPHSSTPGHRPPCGRLAPSRRTSSPAPASTAAATAAAVEGARTGSGAAGARAQGARGQGGPTLICVPITAPTAAAAEAEVRQAAAAGADVAELRLDYLRDLSLEEPTPTLQRLLAACEAARMRSLVTFRPKDEGGLFEGEEADRLAVLKHAADLGARYIDVEFKCAKLFFAGCAMDSMVPVGTDIIVSHHDWQATTSPKLLDTLAARMFDAGADIVKIATTAQDVLDAAIMLALPSRVQGPCISLAMGEAGVLTRLLAAKAGSALTFAALDSGRQSAPGQPSIAELTGRYRFREQSAATQVYGVVGNPVGHSRSPALHNAALRSAGLDAVYVPFPVDDLPTFLEAFSGPDYRGLSVTIPHKVAALECASSADEVARQIGAANTLVRQQSREEAGPSGRRQGSAARPAKWKAYNTDWSAAMDVIEAELGGPGSLEGLTVVVVGAGGAGKALAYGAAHRGASVVVANRARDKAEALAAALPAGRGRAAALEDVAQGRVAGDVLANATSVGMAPAADATPVGGAALGAYRLVFDAVYTPRDTRLLREAKAAGAKVVGGIEMLLGQAAQQFALFTGRPAPVAAMREAALEGLEAG